MYSKE